MEPSGDPQPPNDQAETLDVADLQSREPFGLFRQWVQEAEKVEDPLEAHVLTLATANKEGVPSARSMSMKKLDNRGLIVFTCYEGRKARELEENPHCSVVFYWIPLNKSVRIDGTVEPAPEESEAVFSELPRGLQIVAHVGTQSAVIPNKEESMKRKQELMLEFSDESKPVPKPHNSDESKPVPKPHNSDESKPVPKPHNSDESKPVPKPHNSDESKPVPKPHNSDESKPVPKPHNSDESKPVPKPHNSDESKPVPKPHNSDESKPVPKPDNWGCYRVVPTVFEFRCGHSHWLCDRLRFRRPREGEVIDKSLTMEMEDGWLLERLSH